MVAILIHKLRGLSSFLTKIGNIKIEEKKQKAEVQITIEMIERYLIWLN